MSSEEDWVARAAADPATREGVETTARGLRYFTAVMSLTVIGNALPALTRLVLYERLTFGPQPTGFSAPPVPGATYAGVFPLGLKLGFPWGELAYVGPSLIALASVFVLALGWSRWRDGLRRMGEGAPRVSGAQVDGVRRAVRSYHATIGLYIALALLSTVASTTLLVSGLSAQPLATSLHSDEAVYLPLLSLPLIGLTILLYRYAARGFHTALVRIATAPGLRSLRRGSWLLLIGGVVSGVPALELYFFGSDILRFVGPFFVRAGLFFFLRAYAGWPTGTKAPKKARALPRSVSSARTRFESVGP
jgi:hypothetical protein